MKINEIFKSISGESKGAGFPCIFIRTYGCNLRCSYCDTMYAVEGGDFTNMSPAQILEQCKELGVKRVILTGGEPLIQPEASILVDLLCDNGYEVEIETNGAVDLPNFHKKLKTKNIKNLSYTMDYKTPTSGECGKMLLYNFGFLSKKDVIKFVVGSLDDLDLLSFLLKTYETNAQVFVSPIFGKIEPKEIVEYLLENNLNNVRMQLQMHKFIWDVNERGV